MLKTLLPILLLGLITACAPMHHKGNCHCEHAQHCCEASECPCEECDCAERGTCCHHDGKPGCCHTGDCKDCTHHNHDKKKSAEKAGCKWCHSTDKSKTYR